MTVHMFRVFIGRGSMSIPDLETRISDWVAAHSEWGDDTVGHALSERTTQNDGAGDTYYAVSVRFVEMDTKSNLLKKLTDKLKNKVDWYRAGYHTCTHDGTGGPCSWDDALEWTAKDTTIPAGVPAFTII